MKTQFRVWIFYDQKAKKESAPLSLVQAQIYILKLKIKDFESHLIWTPGWKGWAQLGEFLDSEQEFFTKLKTPHPKKSKTIKQNEFCLPSEEDPLSAVSGENIENSFSDKSTDVLGFNDSSSEGFDEKNFDKTLTSKPCLLSDHELKDSLPQDPGEVIESSKKSSPYWDPEFSIHDVKRGARDQHLINIKFERERRRQTRHRLQIEILIVSSEGRSFRSLTHNISLSGVLLEKPLPKAFARGFFDVIVINKYEEDHRKSRLLLRCKAVGDVSDPTRLTFVAPSDETLKKLAEFIEFYESKARQIKSGTNC